MIKKKEFMSQIIWRRARPIFTQIINYIVLKFATYSKRIPLVLYIGTWVWLCQREACYSVDPFNPIPIIIVILNDDEFEQTMDYQN